MSFENAGAEVKALVLLAIVIVVAIFALPRARDGEWMQALGLVLVGGVVYMIVNEPSTLGDFGAAVKDLFEKG